MKATQKLGLSGKARRVRDRSRAARLHSGQFIHEYLAPDDDDRYNQRFIPIGGRDEFLPSVVHLSLPQTETADTAQLELPLNSDDSTEPFSRHSSVKPKVVKGVRRPLRDAAIHFPPRATATTAPVFTPLGRLETRRTFTLRGFLIGCALGSAAASVLLLVLQIAVS